MNCFFLVHLFPFRTIFLFLYRRVQSSVGQFGQDAMEARAEARFAKQELSDLVEKNADRLARDLATRPHKNDLRALKSYVDSRLADAGSSVGV